MKRRALTIMLTSLLSLMSLDLCAHQPIHVLSIEERIKVVNDITLKRLNELLPRIMRETGFDMWLVICNEDNLDPVFDTLIPYNCWAPITQILAIYDPGHGKPLERWNISRTNMLGFHKDVWDYQEWDKGHGIGQWDRLKQIIRERDPKNIAIDESDTIWAADGLTASLKKRLVGTIGPGYSSRLHSAENLVTLWLETLLDEEMELCERAHTISRAIIEECFSSEVLTPGVTTPDEISNYFWQRAANLGLQHFGSPPQVRVKHAPDNIRRYGKTDPIIHRGDCVYMDTGITYLRYHTDSREWAYVLRLGETDVPDGLKHLMSEVNRLQDIFCSEFREGLTGNQVLLNIVKRAHDEGIRKPMIYSHSIGLCLHEPGPLIGLPWEQEDTGERGEVKLVPNSTFACELNAAYPIPEWGGEEVRMQLENGIAFTKAGVFFLDRRQTEFHIVK